ncbi:MAG: hypothetical protein ACK559_41885, partial [bacterium]
MANKSPIQSCALEKMSQNIMLLDFCPKNKLNKLSALELLTQMVRKEEKKQPKLCTSESFLTGAEFPKSTFELFH